jgi:methanogenic corrinoid protein MtbC1
MTALATLDAKEIYRDYLAAIRSGDRREAFSVIDAAREADMELGALYVEVFQPAMREIGRLWQENEITVADEHLATAITQAAMARAFEQVFAWGPERGRSLIAACADLERHEVGLRMICDLLELRGWDTTYLGATVPVESLVAMVQRKRPDVVALSAAIAPHLPRLRMMIGEIRELIPDPPLILVGGRPFLEDPTLATRLGADLTAPDALQAVELLELKVHPR